MNYLYTEIEEYIEMCTFDNMIIKNMHTVREKISKIIMNSDDDDTDYKYFIKFLLLAYHKSNYSTHMYNLIIFTCEEFLKYRTIYRFTKVRQINNNYFSHNIVSLLMYHFRPSCLLIHDDVDIDLIINSFVRNFMHYTFYGTDIVIKADDVVPINQYVTIIKHILENSYDKNMYGYYESEFRRRFSMFVQAYFREEIISSLTTAFVAETIDNICEEYTCKIYDSSTIQYPITYECLKDIAKSTISLCVSANESYKTDRTLNLVNSYAGSEFIAFSKNCKMLYGEYGSEKIKPILTIFIQEIIALYPFLNVSTDLVRCLEDIIASDSANVFNAFQNNILKTAVESAMIQTPEYHFFTGEYDKEDMESCIIAKLYAMNNKHIITTEAAENKTEFAQNTKGYKKHSTTVRDVSNKIYKSYKKYKDNEQKVDSQLSKAVSSLKTAFLKDDPSAIIEGKKYTPIGVLKTALGTSAIFSVSRIGALVFLIVKHYSSKKATDKQRREIIRDLDMEIELLTEKIEDARGDSNRQAKYQMMRTKAELSKARDKLAYNLSTSDKHLKTASNMVKAGRV